MKDQRNFPSEILQTIFSQLTAKDNKDLIQCSLTCKSWRSIAQKFTFSTVAIKRLGEVNEILEIIATNPFLGELVKILKYNQDERVDENHVANLFVFSQIFPNIEELDFVTPSELFIKCLHQLLLKGSFARLKVLPQPSAWSGDDAYVSCLRLLKDRTTKINLWRDDSRELDTYTLIRNELHLFQKLQFLSIKVKKEGYQTLSDPFELLNSLPPSVSQITFEFNILTHFSPESYNDQPIFHLQHLSIDYQRGFFFASNNCLIYMMKKFPQLLSLTIDSPVEYTSYANDIHTSLEVICNFIHYISKMSSHCIRDLIIDGNDVKEAITQYYKATNDSVNFWIRDELILRSNLGASENALLMVAKTNSSKQRRLEIAYDMTREPQSRFELLQVLQHYRFNYLQISHDYSMSTIATIECVLKSCPHLSQLSVRGYAILLDESTIFADQQHNLKTLDLEDFKEEFFPYIVKRFTSLHTLKLCRLDLFSISEGAIQIALHDFVLTKLVLKVDTMGILHLFSRYDIYFKLFIQKNQQTSYTKLCSSRGSHFHKQTVDFSSPIICDPYEYGYSVTNGDCISYEIVCGSVDEVVFEIDSGEELLLYKQA